MAFLAVERRDFLIMTARFLAVRDQTKRRLRTTLSDESTAIGYSFLDCACVREVMSML
jgi:hypothetical protein